MRQLISTDTQNLVNLLENAEGEITPEIESIMLTISKKADQSALFIDRADIVIEHLKKIIEQVKGKINALESAQDFVKTEIKKSIMITGQNIEGEMYQFKLAKAAPKVVIDDESKIVEPYIRIKEVVEIDKKALGEDLKSGKTIDGAKLEENFSLRKSIITPKLGE